MIKVTTDVVFLGYGEITHKLIVDILDVGLNVVCITNNRNVVIESGKYNLQGRFQVIDRNRIMESGLQSGVAFFSWRDSDYFLGDKSQILHWMQSPRFSTKKSYLLSSASVYRDSLEASDESDSNLANDVEKNQKYQLELKLENLMWFKDIPHTNLRIANIYGSNIKYGVIGSVLSQIQNKFGIVELTNLNIIRDYLSYKDFSSIILWLIDTPTSSRVLNIGTGIGSHSSELLLEFAKSGITIKELTANSRNLRHAVVLNPSLLNDHFAWTPRKISEEIPKLVAELN